MRCVAVLTLLLSAACRQHQPQPQPQPVSVTTAPIGTSVAAPWSSPQVKAEPVNPDPEVVQPVALSNAGPDCSGIKGLRIGMVALQATITAKGTVENVHVIRPLSPEADAALAACVTEWRYTPGTYKGKPVPVQLTITINIDG